MVMPATEMGDYTLTPKMHRQLKSRLTKALNTHAPDKILAEVAHAKQVLEQHGWPDDWSRWQRAQDDAELTQHYQLDPL